MLIRVLVKAFEDLPSSKEFPVDESVELLTLALSHMYSNCDPHPMTLDNVRDLVAFFSKYDAPECINACDTFLSASVVLDTASLPEWIGLADQHKLACFLQKCVSYAAEHLFISGTPETWLVQLQPATLAVW